MILGYQKILSFKNHTRKIDKIHKDFELYQVFKHNFLYKNVWIFPLYILLTSRINTFWSGGIKTFLSQIIYCQHTLKTFTRFYYLPIFSVKICSISFFSSSGKHQSHHPVGCHTTDINFFAFVFFYMLCIVYIS